MKFFQNKKESEAEDLSAELDNLKILAELNDKEATSQITKILTLNTALNPYAKTAGQSSPFEIAFSKGNIESLYAMYQHKPDINHKHLLEALASTKLLKEMENPSHDIERIQFLLEAGADPTKNNKDGRSSLNMATDLDNLELLHIMSPYVSSNKSPYLTQNATQLALFREVAKESPNHDNIKFLLEKGANPFLKMPDTREADKALDEIVKRDNPNTEKLKELLEKHTEDTKKSKEVSAFDLLSDNPHNLETLHLMYQRLPKELEQERASYSNTLTNLVQNRLQQNLSETENSFTQFNQIVAAAEKSKLPGISEYAANLMEPHFTKALEEVKYDVNDYYIDNPGILALEKVLKELGEKKSKALNKATSIEVASDEEFNKYISDNIKEIFNKYADITADDKYNYCKKQNPSLSDQELLDKFISKEMQQDIFHEEHLNKILEKSVVSLIGEENLESFKNAEKKVLSDLEITRSIEEKQQDIKIKKVEEFLDSTPLLTNDSYHKHAPDLINFALDNFQSNPQILEKTIALVKKQNIDNLSIVENMTQILVDYSNDLSSPARALALNSILKESSLPLPENYKLGQLSTEEIEALQSFAALTKNTDKTLSEGHKTDEIDQMYEDYSKLGEKKLPQEMQEFIRASLVTATQKYFENQLETSKDIIKTINNMVEISKNSEVILATYDVHSPEELSNILTHDAASNIMSKTKKSPTKLHLKKIEDHKKIFEYKQQELSAKINSLSEEIKDIQVIKPSNLLNSKAQSEDDLKVYSTDRKKQKAKKEKELEETKKTLDSLSYSFNKEQQRLESELKGETLANEQRIYDDKLEQFHQFLLQKPSISNTAPKNQILSSYIMDIAIENIDRKPELMDQTITLFREQYSTEQLIKQVKNYRDSILSDKSLSILERKKIENYFSNVIELTNDHYIPNSPDGNATLNKALADIASDEFTHIANQIKTKITTPCFPQISNAIRTKLHDKETSPEQKALLSKILVEQLNEKPPLDIKMLQSLQNKESLKRILDASHPHDISTAIINADNNLAKDIYLAAPHYNATTPQELKKLLNIALLQQDDNSKMLNRVMKNIKEKKDIISVELLQDLYKAAELDKLLSIETLDHVLDIIIKNPNKVEPNLICKIIEITKEMDNKKLSEIANIILNDESKIKQISKENIKILAPYYDYNNHEPLFLKELIDVHDTSFKQNRFDRIRQKLSNQDSLHVESIKNNIRLAMTKTSGNKPTELPDIISSLTKYLKTKRSIFKSFFRNQEEKITKRVGELIIGANAFKMIEKEFEKDKAAQNSLLVAFKESFKELFKTHKKTITLENIETAKMKKVLKDAASQQTIDPDLATRIFHKAMSLEVLDDSNQEYIKKLAEISFNHREKGESTFLTNAHIKKLSEIYPNDEFYTKATKELDQQIQQQASLESEANKEPSLRKQLENKQDTTKKTERSLKFKKAKKPVLKACRALLATIEKLRASIIRFNPVPSGEVYDVNSAQNKSTRKSRYQ